MAYIIGSYNKYDSWHREHQQYMFYVNELPYAIYEVELEWGLPQLPIRTDRNECAHEYYIYNTKEEAMEFVRMVKGANAR